MPLCMFKLFETPLKMIWSLYGPFSCYLCNVNRKNRANEPHVRGRVGSMSLEPSNWQRVDGQSRSTTVSLRKGNTTIERSYTAM